MTLPGGDPGLGPGIWSRRTFLHKNACDTSFQTAIGLLSPNIWVPEVLDPTKVLQGPPRGFLGTWDLEAGDPFPQKNAGDTSFPTAIGLLSPNIWVPEVLDPTKVLQGPPRGFPGPGIWSRRTFLYKNACDTSFPTAIGLLSPNIWVPEVLYPTKVLQGPPRGVYCIIRGPKSSVSNLKNIEKKTFLFLGVEISKFDRDLKLFFCDFLVKTPPL